jgi:hypothetical protein
MTTSSQCHHSDHGYYCYLYCYLGCPDDAIAGDDVIPIDVRLYIRNISKITGQSFMKFGMDSMLLVPSLKWYFLMFFNQYECNGLSNM